MNNHLNILEYDRVTVCNDGESVLENFCLKLRKGEKVVITGRSGVGKTTVLRLPLGFRRPDAGHVLYKGTKIDEHLVWDVRREVAYISQDVALGHGTVQQFLDRMFSYRVNASLRSGRKQLAEELARLELPVSILKKSLADISGGEKQRIGILAALLLKRDIFLLDEITAALDPHLKQHIMTMFFKEPAWTVLAVSHDAPAETVGIREVKLG